MTAADVNLMLARPAMHARWTISIIAEPRSFNVISHLHAISWMHSILTMLDMLTMLSLAPFQMYCITKFSRRNPVSTYPHPKFLPPGISGWSLTADQRMHVAR